MKSAANTIHALARKLGVEKARVVGHDIGLMVAYAYAAQFPSETEKLVVMDAFLPGVEGGDAVYNNPNCGISVFMDRRRKRWCRVASACTSIITGPISPQTKTIRCRRPTAPLTQRHTRAPDA